MEKKRPFRVTVCFDAEEYRKLRSLCAQSGYHNLSKLIRDGIFKKPLRILHRNHSVDMLISAIAGSHDTLRQIEAIFRQQYEAYGRHPPDHEWTTWMTQQEGVLGALSVKFDELNAIMIKCYDTCMHI